MKSVGMVLLIVLVAAGCAEVSRSSRIETGFLCDKSTMLDYRLKRLSFERPSVFQNVKCGKVPDIVYVGSSDKVSMGSAAIFLDGGKYAETASLDFKVDGRLNGGRLGDGLPPDEFEVFHRESAEYPRLRRVVQSEQVERAGMQCVRFVYSLSNEVRKAQEIEYWCWESISGVSGPFLVSAFEAVSPSEALRYDLDKEFFETFFSTVRLNKLPADVLGQVENFRRADCKKNKKFFDRNGVGWLPADYPNNRRALLLMSRCGYPVQVPVNDGQELVPVAVRLWDHASERPPFK